MASAMTGPSLSTVEDPPRSGEAYLELGQDTAPDPEVVDKINALLSEVSDDLKLT